MRVPSYYCPHCGRFKKLFQVEWCEYSQNFYCRHCGNRIMETEELFLDIVNQICVKKEGENVTKHFCDLCGKEIPLKSAIFNYIPASDESPVQYDVCTECDGEIAYFIHKLKTQKQKE